MCARSVCSRAFCFPFVPITFCLFVLFFTFLFHQFAIAFVRHDMLQLHTIYLEDETIQTIHTDQTDHKCIKKNKINELFCVQLLWEKYSLHAQCICNSIWTAAAAMIHSTSKIRPSSQINCVHYLLYSM